MYSLLFISLLSMYSSSFYTHFSLSSFISLSKIVQPIVIDSLLYITHSNKRQENWVGKENKKIQNINK